MVDVAAVARVSVGVIGAVVIDIYVIFSLTDYNCIACVAVDSAGFVFLHFLFLLLLVLLGCIYSRQEHSVIFWS
jgi:hypothetical protein